MGKHWKVSKTQLRKGCVSLAGTVNVRREFKNISILVEEVTRLTPWEHSLLTRFGNICLSLFFFCFTREVNDKVH